jgi:hypothetical protein
VLLLCDYHHRRHPHEWWKQKTPDHTTVDDEQSRANGGVKKI